MAEKKRLLLRLEPRVHAAVQRWAADDLRSVNAQIEFLLLEAARRAGRWPPKEEPEKPPAPPAPPE